LNKKLTRILTGLISAFCLSANAATIDLQSTTYTGSSPIDFTSTWNALATPSTVPTSLAEFTGVKTGNNKLNKLTASFDLMAGQSVDFRFGLDAGLGAEFYLDGVQAAKRSDDVWWSNNWNNSDVVTFSLAPLIANASTVLEIFWAERCCNGANSGQFSIDNGHTWMALSTQNLEQLSPVPLPAAAWLFGSALLAFGGMRARQKAKTA